MRALMLNELAQGLRPLPERIAWFTDLDAGEQSAVLRDLRHFCVQARATRDDALAAVRRAGLRATHTPSVLVARGPIDMQRGKVAALTPHHERIKAFRLLIHVLRLADGRRWERFCATGCSHSWHRLAGGADTGTTAG
ncbi:DUF5958 family protein [Streptomyces puniciscabiei]